MSWAPIEDDMAISLLGEGIHTGMRKGRELDSEASDRLWKMIAHDGTGEAWTAALEYGVWALREMGYQVCRRNDGNASSASIHSNIRGVR